MSNVLKPGLAQIRRGITSHHGDGHLEAADWRTAGGIGQVAHAVFRHLDSVEEAEDLVAALNDSLLLPKISSELAQMRQWATVPPNGRSPAAYWRITRTIAQVTRGTRAGDHISPSTADHAEPTCPSALEHTIEIG
jgi:hypothetical protein